MKKNILFLFTTLLCISCAGVEASPDALKIISFMPTQCSEPWDDTPYTDSGANRGNRIVSFLNKNGISNVLNFDIKNDEKIYCASCNCPSGDQVTFKVTASDFEKLKTIAPFNTLLNGE